MHGLELRDLVSQFLKCWAYKCASSLQTQNEVAYLLVGGRAVARQDECVEVRGQLVGVFFSSSRYTALVPGIHLSSKALVTITLTC